IYDYAVCPGAYCPKQCAVVAIGDTPISAHVDIHNLERLDIVANDQGRALDQRERWVVMLDKPDPVAPRVTVGGGVAGNAPGHFAAGGPARRPPLAHPPAMTERGFARANRVVETAARRRGNRRRKTNRADYSRRNTRCPKWRHPR